MAIEANDTNAQHLLNFMGFFCWGRGHLTKLYIVKIVKGCPPQSLQRILYLPLTLRVVLIITQKGTDHSLLLHQEQLKAKTH